MTTPTVPTLQGDTPASDEIVLAPDGMLPLRVNEQTPSVIICANGDRISISWREQNIDKSHSDEYARAEQAAAFLVATVNAAAPVASPVRTDADGETLETYYARQIEWSRETFGPALRTGGVIDHIRKELREIEAEPHDLSEWVDVIILAMDGYWRHGGTADNLMPALLAKQAKNMARNWPDWRNMSESVAIEHDRSGETAALPPEGETGPSVAIPTGWYLVPEVPTEAQMNAGLYQSSHDATYADVCQSYMDMVRTPVDAPALTVSPSPSECDPQPAIRLDGIDEYGPRLGWFQSWTSFPIGTEFAPIIKPDRRDGSAA